MSRSSQVKKDRKKGVPLERQRNHNARDVCACLTVGVKKSHVPQNEETSMYSQDVCTRNPDENKCIHQRPNCTPHAPNVPAQRAPSLTPRRERKVPQRKWRRRSPSMVSVAEGGGAKAGGQWPDTSPGPPQGRSDASGGRRAWRCLKAAWRWRFATMNPACS